MLAQLGQGLLLAVLLFRGQPLPRQRPLDLPVDDEVGVPPDGAGEVAVGLERQGEVQEKLEAMGGWDLDARLEMAMDALRCPPSDTLCKVLSGG